MSAISKQNETITLEYHLFDLPTAQHKAGLAGLIVMIESLKQRKMGPLPTVDMSPAGVKVSFTEKSLQTLMDDCFDAKWVEVGVRQKWPKTAPKRIDEVEVASDGKSKTEKRFVYDAVEPKGAFLQTFYADGDGLWTKLWRNMLWNILRGIPATRKVYEERANGQPSSEAVKTWQSFSKAIKEQKKNKVKTEKLSSSLLIGAEADNPEKVPFVGAAQDNFLLHFWPLVSLIHAPRAIEIKRTEDRLRLDRSSDAGYVLTIPEPFDLQTFSEEIVDVLRSLDTTPAGYRPKEAVIDLFEEGGLEYLHHFARKKTEDAGTGDFTLSLHAVEMYHLRKQGNRIRQLATDRILPNPEMILDYEKVRDDFKNPFYKKIYLHNLLSGDPWHGNADAVLSQEPMPIFIQTSRTPKEVRFFGKDVRRKFESINKTFQQRKGAGPMTEKAHDDQLALLVHRLIQNYIRRRTEEKSGHQYEKFKEHKDPKGRVIYPNEYRESLEKVCADAFLAMRGRRDQDFIEYFTGTICSVPQFLPEDQFLTVARELTENWQKIKTLAMLAISANSYLSGKPND